jgi:formamidopyrimidine-DNA glycosylase
MGQGFHQRRSFARNSAVRMMPEGPEVRTLVDQLQAGVGRRLVDIQFLSGRYVRHGKPESFEAFANTMVPTFQPHSNIPEAIDIIQEWNAKGKFIYMTLDNGNNPPAADDDYQRSIWVTLGMSGQFVTEKVHKQNPRFARWYIELLDVDSMDSRKVYYHDQRNFGTLKFCLSRQELEKKLMSLGLDILDPAITEEDFLAVVDRQKPELNVCKFLMDQSVRCSR